MNEKEKTVYQFQVGYMLNPELNINREFKEQVVINMTTSFSGATMLPVIKVVKKGNTCVILLLMFYENRKNRKFNVFSSIFYRIMEIYIYVLIICVVPKLKFMSQLNYKGFKTEHTILFQELAFLNYS